MITSELADHLIQLPKKIVEDETVLNQKEINPSDPFQERYYMLSEDEEEFSFFLDVTQSAKNALKLTLHQHEEGINCGILRVDYEGRHKNPEEINEHVPNRFKPYAGQWLDKYNGHIHYIVDGYPPLKWAIPLDVHDFPVKRIRSKTDIINALTEFCDIINLETTLDITMQGNSFL